MLPLFDKIPYSNGKNGNRKSDIPPAVRNYVYQRDKYRCRYCGRTSNPLTIDHVYPKKEGGKSMIGNLVTACMECNNLKGMKVGIMWPYPVGHFDHTSKAMEDAMKLSVTTYQMENVLSWYYRLRKIGLYSLLLALVGWLFYIATLFVNFNAAIHFGNFFALATIPLVVLDLACSLARRFLNKKLLSLTERIKNDK